jgi:hypothetical protein
MLLSAAVDHAAALSKPTRTSSAIPLNGLRRAWPYLPLPLHLCAVANGARCRAKADFSHADIAGTKT